MKLHLQWNLHMSWVLTLQASEYFSTSFSSLSAHFFHILLETLCARREKFYAEAPRKLWPSACANIWNTFIIHASPMSTNLCLTGAFPSKIFSHQSLPNTSTTSSNLHCHCVGRTWSTGAPTILAVLDSVAIWWEREETLPGVTFKRGEKNGVSFVSMIVITASCD